MTKLRKALQYKDRLRKTLLRGNFVEINDTKNKRTSKFIREYGATMYALAEKYNVNHSYIWILHQRCELHAFIEEQEAEKVEIGSK